MIRKGRNKTEGFRVARDVSIINDVSNRSEEHHRYCSRVCCASALKYVHQLKSAIPGLHVADLYTDMSTFAKGAEALYARTCEAKATFLMFDKRDLPTVAAAPDGDGMLVTLNEQLSGEEIELRTDLVVLM